MPIAKWSTERDRDVSRKRADSKSERVVVIPKCKDIARRTQLECDDIAWLTHYFGPHSETRDPFWYDFTDQQRRMIDAIAHAIAFGGDQSLAASRGEGKTTIIERLATKYTLQGVLSYTVLFQATGELAENSLDTIKTAIAENPLLLADYPEVCVPVRALENTPNRAHYQIVNGFRHDNGEPFEMAESKFTWCGREVIFPKVPGSPSSGSIVATRGLDAAVRGLKKRGLRPQLAVIDDADTEDTARSADQAKKLEERIDKSIGGLGGQQRPVARVMLCTIPSRISVAYRFTDIDQKPTWRPMRFRFLLTKPLRLDLWEEYIEIRKAELRSLALGETSDRHCRKSHQFYLDHRVEMDEGSEVANEHRFDDRKLPDGSQVEVSAVERYFNEIARIGAEAVATELDNDPPEPTNIVTNVITKELVQRRLSGMNRGELPPNCKLVVGIDLGKFRCYWVALAVRRTGIANIVHYDSFAVHGTQDTEQKDVIQKAIFNSLVAWKDQLDANPFVDGEGVRVPFDQVLIDSGYFPESAYEMMRRYGQPFKATKGQDGTFKLGKRTQTNEPGQFWAASWQPHAAVWLYLPNVDHWKQSVHNRFLADPVDDDGRARPGSLTLFSPSRRYEHREFSEHIVAELWQTEFIPGKGEKPGWNKISRTNHYLDATALCLCAAEIAGFGVFTPEPNNERRPAVISAGVSSQARW